LKKGYGLIIPEIKSTILGCHFLSKIYWYKECYVRDPARLMITGNYSLSTALKEGCAPNTAVGNAFRRGVYNQLITTGDLNPITGGHSEHYKRLGIESDLIDTSNKQEKLEALFKVKSVSLDNTYTSMIANFLDQERLLISFEDKEHYYSNLRNAEYGIPYPKGPVLTRGGSVKIQEIKQPKIVTQRQEPLSYSVFGQMANNCIGY